jgi:hypothetical protein
MTRRFFLIGIVIGLCALTGCIGKRPKNPAATQPVTAVDPVLAEPEYWLKQPPTAEVSGGDFDRLWETCDAVAHEYLFAIDRRDYRGGLMTTAPMISKQFFELWRKDAGKASDVTEASIATIRRTIHFQFHKNPDGTYTVAPKILVERQAVLEPKYRLDPDLPGSYWYAVRRDTVLEGQVGESIRKTLEKK